MAKKGLLHILKDLNDEEFKDFKWYLKDEKVGNTSPIQESRLSNAERRDVVDLMVQKYEFAGAEKVTKTVLKKISRNDLVMKLPTITSGGKDQERVLQRRFPVVEKQFKLVEDEFSREMCAHHPKMQIFSGVNVIVLEGPDKEVQLADTKLEYPIKQLGEVHAVKERIEILEKRSLTRKGLQVVEKQFKLVEEEFRREMCADDPKVKIHRGVNSVILEGPNEEVQLAETKLEELIKQLKEKRIKLSAALITFMTSSGVISKYQTRFQRSLRSPVALEVGSDLVLSSLSSAALDEAETAVLRDLSEVTVRLQGSTASSPHLDKVKEILIKAKNEANLQELRVEVSLVPRAAVIKVQLVGYTEHVNKLKDLLLEYQIEHSKNLHPQRDEVQKNISDKNRQAEGADEKLVDHRTTQDSYTEKRKISIVVLGTADHMKKNLTSIIMGRDIFAHRSSDVKIETHGNDTYEVTFTPNMYKASEEIGELLSSEQPDMCLLVVEDGFSTQEVWQQIDELHKITRKPSEEFIVVLPLRCKPEESYPFKCCTIEGLFSKLAEDRNHMPTNKRSAQRPRPPVNMEKPQSLSKTPMTRWPPLTKKRSKGNHPYNKVNLVLLGMSGIGKSESGNTILGWRQFVSKRSSVPITTECEAAETKINGTCVRVIDTPDMFDDEIKSSVRNHLVTKCRQLCQSDPCVYLLVMHVSRFTDGERDILRKVGEAFGPRAKEQTIILFTHGEELQLADMSFESFLQNCQPELKNIIEQCGGRCVFFENRASRQYQVTELMQTVNMMLNTW